LKKAKEAAKLAGNKVKFVLLDHNGEKDAISLSSILDNDGLHVPKVTVKPEDTFIIPYSSGTTGLPKGVVISHRALVANLQQWRVQGRSLGKNVSILVVLPFFHLYGMQGIMIYPLVMRWHIVVLPRFDFVQFLEAIQKYKIHTLPCVPPMVLAITKNPLVKKYDLSSVKYVASGSAPLSQEVEDQLKKVLPGASLLQTYGMTELPAGSTAVPLDRLKSGSVGILLPNVEAKIIDPNTGNLLGYNQDGELCFRCPNMMDGYLNRPEENIIDSEGFLHTGDVGHIDNEGYFFIVDRLKELIKYKAFQIAPAELEGILLTHPHVLDVGVVGKIDASTKEEFPLAFVVLKPNTKATEKEIYDFVAERTAPYKHLRGGVIFVESIPKSPSGKILRRHLRILLEAGKAKIQAKV